MTCTCHADPPGDGHELNYLVRIAHPRRTDLAELASATVGALKLAEGSVEGATVTVAYVAQPEVHELVTEPEWEPTPTLGAVVDGAVWALELGWAWLRGGRRG